MIPFSDSICPLCSEFFLREHLHDHIAEENPRLRDNTIKMIQAYHPGWLQEHGACPPCWKSFRDAGGMLFKLRLSSSGHALDYTGQADSEVANRKADPTG